MYNMYNGNCQSIPSQYCYTIWTNIRTYSVERYPPTHKLQVHTMVSTVSTKQIN